MSLKSSGFVPTFLLFALVLGVALLLTPSAATYPATPATASYGYAPIVQPMINPFIPTHLTATSQVIIASQGNNFGYVIGTVPTQYSISYAGNQYGYQIASVKGTGGIAYSPTTTISYYEPTYSGYQTVAPYGYGSGFVTVPYTVKWTSTATSTGYVAIQTK